MTFPYFPCRALRPFAMDNVVLALTIRWLPAVDAFYASCMSREWNAALSSEEDESNLWKQVSTTRLF